MTEEINPYAAPSSEVEAPSSEPNHSGAGRSPYGPYRNNKGLAITITLFFIIFILCRIAEGFIAFEALAIVQHSEGVFGINDIEELADYERTLILFSLLIGILLIIFWCVWTNRSCKNAWLFRVLTGRYLRPGSGESYTPGWAVGWYFVPFAMLWKPYQAMVFIRDSIQSSRGNSTGPLLGVWWTFWLLSTTGVTIVEKIAGSPENLEQFIQLQQTNIALLTLPIISAVVASLLVYRLTSIQAARANEFGIH